MDNHNAQSNRTLAIVLIIMYLISISGFIYLQIQEDMAGRDIWMILVNALIVSIPLVLVFGAIYILITAWQEHKSTGQVNPRLAKIIRWAPRVASIMIIFFLTLFSLDVFDGSASWLEMLGGFIMHSLPSIVLILLLIFAWKRPLVGFWAFLIFGVLFGLRFVRDIYSITNMLFFVFPFLLISGLFYIDWKWLSPPVEVNAG